MSAYMVDREHVVYLVEASISHALARGDGGRMRWRGVIGQDMGGGFCELRCTATADERAAVGNMLWRANEESIRARYPQCKTAADFPGNGRDAATGYTLTGSDFGRPPARVDPVQVLKSCNAFRYQACEHAGWDASEACSFIDALREKAISCLPGYEDASWGAPESNPLMGSGGAVPAVGSVAVAACQLLAAWDKSNDDADLLSKACSAARAAIRDTPAVGSVVAFPVMGSAGR
jgi:hypothetical protein